MFTPAFVVLGTEKALNRELMNEAMKMGTYTLAPRVTKCSGLRMDFTSYCYMVMKSEIPGHLLFKVRSYS